MVVFEKYDEAKILQQRALEGYQEALGEEHSDTLTAVNNMALLLRDLEKYDEAEILHRRVLEGR
jgi:hypothetical protein